MRELHRVRVAERRTLADGVVGLTLVGLDEPLPGWTPGAHVDLVLPSGLVRQYSLCGPLASRDRYEVAVLLERDGRGGSVEVHDALPLGADLRVTPPTNRFALERAERYLFIAGGIGITPLLPMIEAVDGLGLEWHLAYGGRSRASMAFLDHLDLVDLGGDRVTVVPQDELGLLDLRGILDQHRGAEIYTCGPGPLIQAVQELVDEGGHGRLHFERFVAAPASRASETQAAAAAAGAFEVQLGEEGRILDVPADTSILQVVLDSGADILFSCEEGTCGSCETRVLAGLVDHRDDLLSDEERADGQMLICVSRALSPRLVLDIEAS